MIAVGQKIDTTFPVKVVQGGEKREVVFGDLLTRRAIVSVYMKNNTPSCDRQNDALVGHAKAFERLGYQLIAVSRDTCGSHLKYAAKKGIDYILVSDPDDAFAHAADSVISKAMYGRTFQGPTRAAYILDTDGTVLAVIEKVDTKDHAAQLAGVLAGL
ncbi:MAG: redoxin domain-containing protein [Rariglobus sp.]